MKKEAIDVKGVVSNIFASVYNPNDKAGSLIAFLTPGIISTIMSSLGLGMYPKIIFVLMNIFGVDINGIISNIAKKIAPMITSGEVSESDITQVVTSEMDSGFGASKSANLSFDKLLIKEAKAGSTNPLLEALQSALGTDTKHKFSNGSKSVFTKIFIKILTVVISSMGILLVGQGVKGLAGKPSVFNDQFVNPNQPTPNPASKSEPGSKNPKSQSPSKEFKFKLKPGVSKSSRGMWVLNIGNNKRSIQQFVIDCVRNSFDVSSLSDNEIKRSSSFSHIVDDIVVANSSRQPEDPVLIPSEYKNELTIAYLIVKEL